MGQKTVVYGISKMNSNSFNFQALSDRQIQTKKDEKIIHLLETTHKCMC